MCTENTAGLCSTHGLKVYKLLFLFVIVRYEYITRITKAKYTEASSRMLCDKTLHIFQFKNGWEKTGKGFFKQPLQSIVYKSHPDYYKGNDIVLQYHSLGGSPLIGLCPCPIVVSAAETSCSSIWITMGCRLTPQTPKQTVPTLDSQKKPFSCHAH